MKKALNCIGIDLHKAVIPGCVLNNAGEVVEEFRQRLEEPDAETTVLQHLRAGKRVVLSW